MATRTQVSPSGDAAILARLFRPDREDLPAEAARALLAIRFDAEELSRLHDLVTRNQDDALTPAEKRELESYLRVSAFLDLMHARARRALKRQA
jgi:hypothetical protein